MNFFEGTAGAALSGAGAGLAESQNKLMTAAREQREAPIRALNLQTAQEQSAMSHDAFVKWQKDQETVPTEELIKTNPLGADLLNLGVMSGKIDPNKDKYTKGEIKQIQQFAMQNPHLLQGPINDKIKAADDMSKKYDITIGKLNEKMQKLNEDPVGNEESIAKLTGEIKQRQQEQAEINAGRDKFKAMGTNLSVFKTMNDRKNMTKEDLVISDMRMKQGFPGDAEDVVKWREEHKSATPVFKTYARTTKSGKEVYWHVNEKDIDSPSVIKKLNDEQWHPYSAPTIGSMSQAAEGSVEQIAKDLVDRKLNWDQAQATLGRSTKAKTELINYMAKNYPTFNYWDNQATGKYYGAPNTQEKLRFINSLLGDPKTGDGGQLKYVLDLSNKVDRTQIPKLNKVILAGLKDYAGDEPTAKFMAGLYNVALESARAAAGTGSVIPQERVDQELKRISESYNKNQLSGVFDVLRKELTMRKNSITKGTPQEQTGQSITTTSESKNPFDN